MWREKHHLANVQFVLNSSCIFKKKKITHKMKWKNIYKIQVHFLNVGFDSHKITLKNYISTIGANITKKIRK